MNAAQTPSASMPKVRFAPRLCSLLLQGAVVIFGLVSLGFYISGLDTIRSHRTKAEQSNLSLRVLNTYLGLATLDFEHNPADLDRLEREARDNLRRVEGRVAPALQNSAREVVRRVSQFRAEPTDFTALAVGSALSDAQTLSEDWVLEMNQRQLRDPQFWIWRFWTVWVVSGVFIWGIGSFLIFWWVRPVLHLAQRLSELDVKDFSRDFEKRFTLSGRRYWLVPREVHQLWLKIHALLQSVANAREADFAELTEQKARAEAAAAALRESAQSKGHFVGLLSHEIRTPVTSLLMATRLLQRSVEEFANPIHKKLVLSSGRDVERLRELLDDLLSISRFESDQLALARRPTDLKRILRNSQESFKCEARDRGVLLRTEVAEGAGEWLAEVDGAKLGWALSNVTLHSLRHTPNGGEVTVELRRSASSDGARFLEFRIRDMSVGVTPERIHRKFEPFGGEYELRIARSDSTGSSLAIARSIVEAHGGSLMVCSDPGQGCEFQLKLPEGIVSTGLKNERNQDGQITCSG